MCGKEVQRGVAIAAGYSIHLHQGDAGPGVAWVKAQLARMDGGKADDMGPAYFDAALEDRVRKLQIGYGIKPDGIVGPETLFALLAFAESGPHLYRKLENSMSQKSAALGISHPAVS